MDIEQLAGTKLGNYEIETLLGRGVTGVVYKALQISLDRSSIRKNHPSILNPELSFVDRFQNKPPSLPALAYPNVVHMCESVRDKYGRLI